MFDLDEILVFQLKNDIQIIRGEDYNYMCYINKSVYATGLTPMFALSYGIKKFKQSSLCEVQSEDNKLPIPHINNRRELLCVFFKYFRDNGEANIGMSIEQFVDTFLNTQ